MHSGHQPRNIMVSAILDRLDAARLLMIRQRQDRLCADLRVIILIICGIPAVFFSRNHLRLLLISNRTVSGRRLTTHCVPLLYFAHPYSVGRLRIDRLGHLYFLPWPRIRNRSQMLTKTFSEHSMHLRLFSQTAECTVYTGRWSQRKLVVSEWGDSAHVSREMENITCNSKK